MVIFGRRFTYNQKNERVCNPKILEENSNRDFEKKLHQMNKDKQEKL